VRTKRGHVTDGSQNPEDIVLADSPRVHRVSGDALRDWGTSERCAGVNGPFPASLTPRRRCLATWRIGGAWEILHQAKAARCCSCC